MVDRAVGGEKALGMARGFEPTHLPLPRIETPHLNEIRRQAEPWAREAAYAIAEGRVGEALAAYDTRGFVQVGASKADTVHALVTQWVKAGEQHPTASRLILAGERADVRALNAAARDHLQRAGQLGNGPADRHRPRPTRVRGRGSASLHPQFDLPRSPQRPALGTVEGMAGTGEKAVLQVRLDEGARRIELPLQHYPHVDHGYALTTHKAQGVTVDHAFVLAGGKLADREIGLVQLSRHRESAHLFVDRSFYEAERVEHGPNRSPPPTRMAETPEPEARATLARPSPPTEQLADGIRETMTELAGQLQVSHQKDTTQDYRPARQPSPVHYTCMVRPMLSRDEFSLK